MKLIDAIKKVFSPGYQTYSGSSIFKLFQAKATNYSGQEALDAYKNSLYVYACVNKRAKKVGELINFYVQNPKTGKPIDDSILKVLNKPNKYQTKNEFFELYQTYKDLVGITYIHLIRANENSPVREMYLLNPVNVKMVMNEDNTDIDHFTYTTSKGGEKRIDASDVLFSSHPSPFNQLLGMSPIQPTSISVDTEKQLSMYQYSVLQNGGRIEGILTFDSIQNMTEEQMRKIKQDFKTKYAGSDNAGEPLVLYGGGDYKNLGLTPSELSFIESKRFTREDILLAYGVPKEILGLTDDASRANAQESNRMFIRDVIKPEIENIINKFNEFVLPENKKLYCIDPTPQNTEEILKKIETGKHFLTINEKRALLGLEPVDDGDTIYVPFNETPLGSV